MKDTVGLDFGTSTTLLGRRTSQWTARVLPIGTATSWMPTVAAVPNQGSLVVGEDAESYSERILIRSIKTALGQGEKEIFLRTDGDDVRSVYVDEVVEAVLREAIARSRANSLDLDHLPVRMACPAHWSGEARSRLLECATAAGLSTSIGDLLDEPIAAGVSWIMHRIAATGEPPDGRVVVFDAGGGTLDVAVMDVKAATPPEITVLSSMSVPEAGDRLDQTIAGEIEAELHDSGHVDRQADSVFDHLLRLAARRLKEQLSYSEEASTALGAGHEDLPPLRYTRHQLEAAFSPQLERAISLIDGALKGAELRRRNAEGPSAIRQMNTDPLRQDVKWVLLSGGMSRVPAVQARLLATFPNATVETDPGLGSPEESVVAGLTFDDVVSDLNLHRPAFNFVVEFHPRHGDGYLGEQVIYPAFSPLYSPDEVLRGESRLGYSTRFGPPAADGDVTAKVTCRSVDGQSLDLHLDGQPVAGIEVPLDRRHPGGFKLYVDGRIVISGAKDVQLRVERWPIIRSRGRPTPLRFETARSAYDDDDKPPNWWSGGKY